MSSKLHKIILSADDYGIAPGVSRAIIELIKAGRLSATGCMSISPYWPELAPEIREFKNVADIGLHLTLTQFRPLGAMPNTAPDGILPSRQQLLLLSRKGQLDLVEIREELERQINAFEEHFGGPPAFLDGHHYVQHSPGIREVIVDYIAARYPSEKPGEKPGEKPYIRVCKTPLRAILQRRIAIIQSLKFNFSGAALERLALARGIPVNNGYSGFYDRAGPAPLDDIFKKFLTGVEENSLIGCHPGLVDDELVAIDTLTIQREVEFNYLMGEQFPITLERAGARLGKFKHG